MKLEFDPIFNVLVKYVGINFLKEPNYLNILLQGISLLIDLFFIHKKVMKIYMMVTFPNKARKIFIFEN